MRASHLNKALCFWEKTLKHKIYDSFGRDLFTHKKGSDRTALEQYHVDCWKTCRSIETAIKKLKISEQCLRHSYKFCPNEHEIAEYIEFHIENYLIRSRTIYDRVLIFTNFLCDIQMAKDSVNHQAIITNGKVIRADLVSLLKSVNKACSSYRLERNGVIHHDKYHDEELEWVDTARKAKRILGGDLTKIGLSDEIILEKTAAVIFEHLVEFEKNTESVVAAVELFLNKALETYKHTSQQT